jgi:hypothetical protein
MWRSAGLGLASAILMANSPAGAQTDRLVPFNEFMQSLQSASPAAAAPGRVASPAAFSEMRTHLLNTYRGMTVRSSHVLDGATFDCVPVMQQASVRSLGISQVAAPPPSANAPTGANAVRGGATPRQFTNGTDKFGNPMGCETGTIPMRRMTLDEMGRFPTLQAYFQKGPNGAGQIQPQSAPPPATLIHKYAHAYQLLTNYGGTSRLALYKPVVPAGQIFSLSQHWYVSTQSGKTQTVEIGWQKFPTKYNTQNPVTFIYWTADGYKNTGCYNLECGAFVQTNSSLHIGGGWTHYSTIGGAQYEAWLGFVLYNHNWWVLFNNTAIGYYPGSKWGNVNLANHAQEIDYGGETVGNSTNTAWPQMGSGRFASEGWTKAAYQRLIYYFSDNGGAHAYYASLTKSQPSPRCYTINNFTGDRTWHTYFFFGGPGGSAC